MSARDKAKLLLGALEPLQRQLMAADQTWHEVDVIGGVLSARKDELRDTEAWLERTKAAVTEATAVLDELRAIGAKEEARISGRIDPLERELLDLEEPHNSSAAWATRRSLGRRVGS